MRNYTITVSWGCLALGLGAVVVVGAVAVQVLVALGAILGVVAGG